jgi:hypothetical protein
MLETATASAQQTLDRIFTLSADMRYAALYRNGTLTSRQRTSVLLGSSSDSDRYEELLVNPAILTLARQRGNIDCGGAQYVVIRYGHFFQLVIDLPDGHVSVCLELTANPLAFVDAIRSVCS